jgi:hypothetical protein
MNEYLFVFGYESPDDARVNRGGDDAESSAAVWVAAWSEEEAIARGRVYAEQYVASCFVDAGRMEILSWTAGNFAHGIARRPLDEYSGPALKILPRI